MQKLRNFANFMKVCKNYEILPTSWKYAKIMKSANFTKICKNPQIIQTSGKYTRVMKFCQLHENVQKL